MIMAFELIPKLFILVLLRLQIKNPLAAYAARG